MVDNAPTTTTSPAAPEGHWYDKLAAPFRTRLGKMISGFVVLLVGIVLLPLPVVGPAWILIIAGLTMLPFKWSETATAFIRRHIPGIPEKGKIPLRTWIVMGVMIAVIVVVGIFLGPKLDGWIRHLL